MNDFNSIDWYKCHKEVAKLQEKVVVAYMRKDKVKVIKYQELIIKSFAARALAVRKVVTNRGKNTPGIDKEKWDTAKQRMDAIIKLKETNYIAKPLKRVYILKENGSKRPLGIPCMYDRAVQALYALSLDPIAECTSDSKSYGFRKHRSCLDAIKYIHNILSKGYSPRYILEGDIKGFFDNISHDWILKNIPMNKKVLKQFLEAGFIELDKLNETTTGVPQGGIISPIIANMVLNGLEEAIKNSVRKLKGGITKQKTNVVRYADDFIVTCVSKEIITENIIPAITEFLQIRGVKLNMEKTRITTIDKGFDFLGFNIRKYNNNNIEKLLTKPSKKSITKFKRNISYLIKKYNNLDGVRLTLLLNPVIRGWGNYYSSGASKEIFTQMDHYIWSCLWKWTKRKNPNMGTKKRKSLYFKEVKGRDWLFPKEKDTHLITMAKIPIIRHKLVSNDKNPYLSENYDYYEKRNIKKHLDFNTLKRKLYLKTKGLCLVCNTPLDPNQELDVHHILAKKEGGADNIKNLLLIHTTCHKQITYNRLDSIKARNKNLGIVLSKPTKKGK